MKFNPLLFIILVFFTGIIYPQISPGDLTKAHAHLEGISNCTKCHVLGEQVYNSKCLDCHSEIKKLADENRGYHAHTDVKGKNCWSCHSEHHGRNFRIVNFDKNKFNHDKTGFILTGAHTKLKCEDCHSSKFIEDTDLKKRTGTFLGLRQDCNSCHEDFHQGTLGKDCASCHTTEKFRPAVKFDHNNSQFKLTGAHIKVECVSCHPKENKSGKQFQKFKGVLFSSCVNCHKDIHQGKFGNNCQSCHVTASFKQINQNTFDHSKTNFPLLGKHKLAACSDCHKNSLSSKPLHAKCTDCHKDFHKGQFIRNNITADCSECHDEEGFKPSLFTIQRHDSTKFSLTGAHLAVPCQSCHYKNQEWHFNDIGKNCNDCHKNVHGNEITANFMGDNNCSACHLTQNWNTIIFDHSKTEFSLTGKHKEVNCRECHYREIQNGKKEYLFVSLKNSCVSCHKDIHFGQFEESSCLNCHTTDDWRPLKFDHNKTKFPLVGAHQKVKCSQCHKMAEVEGNQFIKFKLEDFKCAACHS
jgi:hypothetical protein